MNENSNVIDTNYMNNENSDKNTVKAPEPVGIKPEPEFYKEDSLTSMEMSVTSNGKSEIIYTSTKRVINTNNPKESDIYNIGKEDIQELLDKGYSIQDILKADEIGNEILEDPIKLLERTSLEKSLDDVKEEVKKEKKEKIINNLKEKHVNEYNKLNDQKFTQEEIINLLTYIDVNSLQLTEELVQAYKKNGDKALINIEKNKLTKETQEKYQLTDKEAEKLSEETIKSLEKIAEKIDKPVKEVIKTYIKCN